MLPVFPQKMSKNMSTGSFVKRDLKKERDKKKKKAITRPFRHWIRVFHKSNKNMPYRRQALDISWLRKCTNVQHRLYWKCWMQTLAAITKAALWILPRLQLCCISSSGWEKTLAPLRMWNRLIFQFLPPHPCNTILSQSVENLIS